MDKDSARPSLDTRLHCCQRGSTGIILVRPTNRDNSNGSSDKGVPPPGAAVAYRRILKDPRDEPQYAERVPYIVSNAEGRRLIDRARMPEEMLANRSAQTSMTAGSSLILVLSVLIARRSLAIDAEYYIRNLLIPPISRIFNLVGADVEHWYDSMPRTKRAGKYDLGGANKTRIDSHFRSSHCVVCGLESSSSKAHLPTISDTDLI